MDCDRAKELFSELHEGSLDAGLRLKAEGHLAGCAACAHEFEGFKALYGRLSHVPAADAPADLSEKIARRLDRADWERRQSARKVWFRVIPIAAAAAAVAAFVMTNRNNTGSGIQAHPLGVPTNESRPLSVRILDGKVHLQLRPFEQTTVSVYQGGSDFVTMPPLNARLLRSDKVAAMARYNVPLDVSGIAETIWVMTSDASEPIHAIFLPENHSGAAHGIEGNLVDTLQQVAWTYGVIIDAVLKGPGAIEYRQIAADSLTDCLTLVLDGTGLTFAESKSVVVVR